MSGIISGQKEQTDRQIASDESLSEKEIAAEESLADKQIASDESLADKEIAAEESLAAAQEENDDKNTNLITSALSDLGEFIIDGISSLFLPSDDFFSTTFDDLNEFFSDRLGLLYTPIDLLTRFVNLIYGTDAEFSGIPFPALTWDGYTLYEGSTVQFDILENDTFKQVQKYLYFLTDVMMIGALVALIQRKYEEVLSG